MSASSQAAKGYRNREAILALIRYCEREGVPFPSRKRVGESLGIKPTSIEKHLEALRDDGTIHFAGRGVYRMGAEP